MKSTLGKCSTVIVATHAVLVNGKEVFGPPHSVVKFLKKNHVKYFFLRFDLYHSGIYPLSETSAGSISLRRSSVLVRLSYLGDAITAIIETLKFRRADVFIGANPINALVGLFLRFLGNVGQVVYFSVDYSPNRFGISFLDFLYCSLDRFCSKLADETWSVSKRIYEMRANQNLCASKNFYLPNSPDYGSFKVKDSWTVRRESIVLVSTLTQSIAFQLILDAVKEVKVKVPNVQLDIIGTGLAYPIFLDLVIRQGLGDTVRFLAIWITLNLKTN